jgi:hypothetical protein
MKASHFTPQFVESIPEILDPGVLYVSMNLASAIHLCACGCGQEVITPLSPTDWKLCFDGENVTLDPSIGNWSFPCRSHYWIRGGKVRWSGSWSKEEVADGRAHDSERKNAYYRHQEIMHHDLPPAPAVTATVSEDNPPHPSWLRRVWNRLTGSE